MRVGAALILVLLFIPTISRAQTPNPGIRSFVGIGGIVQTNDAARRTFFAPPPAVRPMPMVELGFRASQAFGVDIAVIRIQAVSGKGELKNLSAVSDTLTEREQETGIQLLLRRRVSRRGIVSFDLLLGGGLTIEHATIVRRTCERFGRFPIPTCTDTSPPAVRESHAYVGGFDVPIDVGRRAAIAPAVRIMAMRRGSYDGELERRLSSVKAEIGLLLRGFW